jgi:hypothetical protein
MAIELAGQFYEQKRSDRFRSKNSLTRVKYFEPQPDGSFKEVFKIMPFFEAYPTADKFAIGHWPNYVELAKRLFGAMLQHPGVSDFKKECINKAFKEEWENSQRYGSRTLLQRLTLDNDDRILDKWR